MIRPVMSNKIAVLTHVLIQLEDTFSRDFGRRREESISRPAGIKDGIFRCRGNGRCAATAAAGDGSEKKD